MDNKLIFDLTKHLIAVGVFLALSNANAATIYASKTGSISINGEIQKGDFEKFRSTLRRNEEVVAVELNSPGGDLTEAIKIGNLVRDLGLSTFVRKDSICASACFLIWMHGNSKIAAYRRVDKDEISVGLHRPYRIHPETDQRSLEEQKRLQTYIIKYLEENFIPRRLIDVMMSRSSNEIYWLKGDDIDELGEYTHAVQELLISKCEYDYSLPTKMIIAKSQGRSSEVNRISDQIDRIKRCSADVLFDLFRPQRVKFFIGER